MEIFPFGGGVKKDIKIEAMSQKLDAYLCGNFFFGSGPKETSLLVYKKSSIVGF